MMQSNVESYMDLQSLGATLDLCIIQTNLQMHGMFGGNGIGWIGIGNLF